MSEELKLKPARKAHERSLYFEWLLTPDRMRKVHDLPLSEREFASRHDLDARQLRRWKQDPAFQTMLENERKVRASEAPHAATPARPAKQLDGDPLELAAAARGVKAGDEEYDYLRIRIRLADEAAKGNAQAAQAWLKAFGEPFIAAERAERARVFPDLDDAQLVDRTLTLIGADAVSRWLAGSA